MKSSSSNRGDHLTITRTSTIICNSTHPESTEHPEISHWQFNPIHAQLTTSSPVASDSTALQVLDSSQNKHFHRAPKDGRQLCATILLTPETLVSSNNTPPTQLAVLATRSTWLWAQHQQRGIQPARHQCPRAAIRRTR